MTRPWCNARRLLAVCLVAALVGNCGHVVAENAGGPSFPVHGEMVDPDAPAAYRLPLIGICDPAEERIALRTDASATPTTVASSGSNVNVQPAAASLPTTATIVPASAELTSQLLPAVQRGHNLAQRGALFAARTEFVQVLRRVAQAKDAAANTDKNSRALAAGLRALDEADDFVPQGIQLEAEMDVEAVASSHRTPVLRDYPEDVLPYEAVALYHGYAQERLAAAAAGEQAGSMALYGLGKVYARLAERRDNDVQLVCNAMTMYSASLDACPANHLAANELGVLLCRTGHPAEAAKHFERALDIAPNATAYHNLAVAQQKLGMPGQAAANEQESQRLAAWERSTGAVSRRAGVEWVSPAEMARVSQPAPLSPSATNPATASRPLTPNQTKWR